MMTDDLRSAIIAALKRRCYGGETYISTASPDCHGGYWHARASSFHTEWYTFGDTEIDALRALATAIGLGDDGRNPADEIERLTVSLHAVAGRLGCADYDDVRAAVSDALDDAERRERERADDLAAVQRERDEARSAAREYLAALFDCAPKCDRCDHVATRGDSASRRCHRDDCNEEIMCPACLCGDEASSPYYPRCAYCGADVERVVDRTRLEDLPHANALRAANAMMATNDNY